MHVWQASTELAQRGKLHGRRLVRLEPRCLPHLRMRDPGHRYVCRMMGLTGCQDAKTQWQTS
eukprot:4242387-Amphidinium_carterae.1